MVGYLPWLSSIDNRWGVMKVEGGGGDGGGRSAAAAVAAGLVSMGVGIGIGLPTLARWSLCHHSLLLLSSLIRWWRRSCCYGCVSGYGKGGDGWATHWARGLLGRRSSLIVIARCLSCVLGWLVVVSGGGVGTHLVGVVVAAVVVVVVVVVVGDGGGRAEGRVAMWWSQVCGHNIFAKYSIVTKPSWLSWLARHYIVTDCDRKVTSLTHSITTFLFIIIIIFN